MNNKGEINVGIVLMTFLSIIVGLILLSGTFDFIGQATKTFTLRNYTFTFPAAGSTVDLYGQELINTAVITNRSNNAVVPASNYTISEGISSVDGLKRIRLTANAGYFNNVAVNASYDYGHVGYIDDAGGRSIADLIPIFGAIAILVAALALVFREKFF